MTYKKTTDYKTKFSEYAVSYEARMIAHKLDDFFMRNADDHYACSCYISGIQDLASTISFPFYFYITYSKGDPSNKTFDWGCMYLPSVAERYFAINGVV